MGVIKIIVSLVLIFATAMTSGQNACTTHDNRSGTCINIRNCPYHVNLVKTNAFTQQIQDFLRKTQCGWDDNDVKVCCESDSLSSTSSNVTKQPGLHLINDVGCGINRESSRRRGRIYGGQVAKSNEFPWMALLIYDSKQGPEYLCGGSIINNRYILTAAHCVTDLPYGKRLTSVVIGVHDISKYRECSGGRQCSDAQYQEFAIEKVVFHSEYSKKTLQNDIALLKLNRQINFASTNARTICLPTSPEDKIPDTFMLSGWGLMELRVQSPVLLKVELSRFSQDECASTYKQQHVEISHKQICAGGLSGKSGCNGDSGGPLQVKQFYNNMQRTVQYGIVSFGTRRCGIAGYPGVYTRVDYYVDWILDKMRDDF